MRSALTFTSPKLSNNFTSLWRKPTCLGCKGSLVQIQSRRPILLSNDKPLRNLFHKGFFFAKLNLIHSGSSWFNVVRAREVRGLVDFVLDNYSAKFQKNQITYGLRWPICLTENTVQLLKVGHCNSNFNERHEGCSTDCGPRQVCSRHTGLPKSESRAELGRSVLRHPHEMGCDACSTGAGGARPFYFSNLNRDLKSGNHSASQQRRTA